MQDWSARGRPSNFRIRKHPAMTPMLT
jgi:hypothetical protein